ncbi:MAG: transcription-repair coupling factor [Bacteroidetes bacterium MED-G20]|nr:MAG: transcription-repair coupling factor [Bacteroidetes bacterium MED-G20]
MSKIEIKTRLSSSNTFSKIIKSWSDEKGISLKNISGSYISFLSYSIIQEKNGNHLFILSNKEQALYFFNDLENLFENERGVTLLFYPASYRRPYQIMDSDPTSILQRTEVIDSLDKHRKTLMVITYPEAIIEKVITKSNLQKNIISIAVGEDLELDLINELLIELDFEKVDYVYQPGQFAVRGGIVDVFSYNNEFPYRIELFGDEIESIREFDPINQLSKTTLNKIKIVPNINNSKLTLNKVSFFDHFPKNTIIWGKDLEIAQKRMEQGFEISNKVFDKISDKSTVSHPVEMYLSPQEFISKIKKYPTIEWNRIIDSKEKIKIDGNTLDQPKFNKNFDLLVTKLEEWKNNGYSIFICSDQDSQLNRLRTIFIELEKDAICSFVPIGIHQGFVDHNEKLVVFTDHQIFERYHRFNSRKSIAKSKETFTLKEIYDLQKGDFVVHIDYGIGEFSGLEKIDAQGREQEAIRLIYKGGDILYVSIHSLHRISKFSGKDGTKPNLNKLGSPAWSLAKQKAKKRIKEVAFDLIQLYAKRKVQKGFEFQPDTYLQNELEASFIYEDTPDQLSSTEAVKLDMEQPTPMDRLVCGDVGFGKTEVAIRAAFKAVADSKQVAILVPTTVLAFQHYKTFSERLKEFPCSVDYINRFKTSKSIKATLEKVKSGKIDVLIGTHRLISKDVKFKDLGLLIIDEEQKFGVGVKEQLKNMKVNVDTLTLTATPIPRTLQFSLMNARDLSIINTPPQNRFPVETIVQSFSEETISQAINYELQREGQVFFVHNRVQNINEIAGMISRVCPNARIAVGHGQMEGKKLEAIILDFMDGLYDILVATTIIESGIDIPNANTIIINNANHFGLSDLHQLRGRVGRSNKKAFAYLFTPPPQHLSTEARKRLHAIEQFSDLGSGFNIAMRDLDIRGAGDLLGANQSGFINDIGFDTYQKILDEAILELKENDFKATFSKELENRSFVNECILETDLSLVIPDDYVNEINERLNLYKRLDQLTFKEAQDAFVEELKDRFGEIPLETVELIKTLKLRELGKKIGLEKLIIKRGKMVGKFTSSHPSYFESDTFTQVLSYVQKNKRGVSLKEKNQKLMMTFENIKSINDANIKVSEILD